MERKSKLSLSLTLIFIAMLALGFTSLVYAPAPPNPDYPQGETFDSMPTAVATGGTGTITGALTNVYDGDLATNINWVYGTPVPPATSTANATGFKKPSDYARTDFGIVYIDIKIHYRIASTTTSNDMLRFLAKSGGQIIILADYKAANTTAWAGGLGGITPGLRTFSDVRRPGGGSWTWAELAAMQVGVQTLRVGTSDFQRIYLYEIFITAYSVAPPAIGTNQMYVVPSQLGELTPGDSLYVDIVVTGVTKLWGYQLILNFDPNVLVPMEYYSYGPFVNSLPSEIGPDYVAVSYKTFDGDPYGYNATMTPIARISFGVAASGGSFLTLTKSEGADNLANAIFFQPHHGFYGPQVPEFPLGLGIMMLLIPALPVVYLWRVRKKERA